MLRTPSELESVVALPGRPLHLPAPRPKGQQARSGLAFQKSFARFLEVEKMLCYRGHDLFADCVSADLHVLPDAWFRYEDAKGTAHAEVDIILVVPKLKLLFLFECKRTATERGRVQLLHLYKPLLERLFPVYSIYPVMPCRNLGKEDFLTEHPIVTELDEIFDAAMRGDTALRILHCPEH